MQTIFFPLTFTYIFKSWSASYFTKKREAIKLKFFAFLPTKSIYANLYVPTPPPAFYLQKMKCLRIYQWLISLLVPSILKSMYFQFFPWFLTLS